MNKDYHTSSVELFQELKWMPLNKQFIFNRAVLMFKCLNNLAPGYMADEFTQIIQTHGYNTRHAQNSLVMPKLRTECLRNSPFVTGISVWNNLDQSVKISRILNEFQGCTQCIPHLVLYLIFCLIFWFCSF